MLLLVLIVFIGVNLPKEVGGSRHEDDRRRKRLGAPWRVWSTRLYRGSGGKAASGVQGQSPWSGVRGAKPPKS